MNKTGILKKINPKIDLIHKEFPKLKLNKEILSEMNKSLAVAQYRECLLKEIKKDTESIYPSKIGNSKN